MEIGGLMAQAFKVFLGNPDIMATVLTFAVFISLVFTAYEVFYRTKN
jgi:hypothetical protein